MRHQFLPKLTSFRTRDSLLIMSRRRVIYKFCFILYVSRASSSIDKLMKCAVYCLFERTEVISSCICMNLTIVVLILTCRSMASLETRSQSRLMNPRLSGVPSDFSKIAQLVSPSSVKPFAPWDRVDGPSPLPTVARISFTCVLKGFCLGASLLPSLRAEYKVRQCLFCPQNLATTELVKTHGVYLTNGQ